MLSQKGAREQWLGRDITYRQNRDGNWRDNRRTKAMSWPKSFLSFVVTSNATPNGDCNDSVQVSIPEETEGHAAVFQKSPPLQQAFPSHSVERLPGDLDNGKMPFERGVISKMNRFSENSLPNNAKYKRWSVDEELSAQPNSRENNSSGKSVSYRRAKGGLRDLIRLHEEEIARASGTPKSSAKKPKHDDTRQCPNLFNVEEYPIQFSYDSKLVDIDRDRDTFIEKNQGRKFLTNNIPVGSDRNDLSTEKENIWQQEVEYAEKSTSTEFPDSVSPTKLEIELNKQVAEKDEFISLLVQEKENLLSKLEEQKKVANAYQKLEDRYRRKVFELEKVLHSCRCGALGLKSPSEQDLTKSFFNGKFELKASKSQLEIKQPSKVDNIIDELETWLVDQKNLQAVHANGVETQDLVASGSSLSSLSEFRPNSFPLEFIDQFDGTSV